MLPHNHKNYNFQLTNQDIIVTMKLITVQHAWTATCAAGMVVVVSIAGNCDCVFV